MHRASLRPGEGRLKQGSVVETSRGIDADLVRGLVGDQFPEWAELPIEPVSRGGWDNRSFRLGTERVVRLPSAEAYAVQVEKEQQWLPRLAPRLPFRIPEPLALGVPGRGYPWKWSIYRWIAGDCATLETASATSRVARGVADFLIALHQIDAADGPPSGAHNFFRGGPLAVYDDETREALSGAQRSSSRLSASTTTRHAAGVPRRPVLRSA